MIIFPNKGLIPIDAITTMGVNVKVTDHAIGHFGTGLKISIASILRMGGSITIYRGKKPYNFYLKRKQVRGKDFDFVMMRAGTGIPQQLAMTTELGKNWKPWMVMRELESNCRDEGGVSYAVRDKTYTAYSSETTTVIVECDEVEREWHDRHEYFITGEPIEKHAHIEVYKGATKSYFYRGIKVGEFTNPLPFTFNLLDDFTRYLSEDRALNSYYALNALGTYIPELKRKDVIDTLFSAEPAAFGEPPSLISMIDFDQSYTNPSKAFFDRIKYLQKANPVSVTMSMLKLLWAHGEGSRHDTMNHYKLTNLEEIMLSNAKSYVKNLGYTSMDGIEIYKTDLGQEAHAMAVPGENKIYLAPSAFDNGQKFLCSTLHEEYLHIRYGLADASRAMQQHLFDRIATLMEEHYYKRPI